MSALRLVAGALLCLPLAMPAGAGMVAAGGSDGLLRAHDLVSGAALWTDDVGSWIHGIEMAEDDTIVVGADSSVRLYGSDGTVLVTIPLGVTGGDWFIPDDHPVALATNGDAFAVAHADGTVRVYSRAGAEVMQSAFPGVHTLDLSADGRTLLAGGTSVRMYAAGDDGWDADDATPLFEDAFWPRIVSLSDDGLWGVAGDWFSTLRVYSTAGRVLEVATLGSIVTTAISPDGRTVVAGNDDPSDSHGARLDVYRDGGDGWDAADATPVCSYDTLYSPNDDIRAVAVSGDASSIAVGGVVGYGPVHVLDTSCSLSFQSSYWHESLTLGITFDGRFVAVGGGDELLVNAVGTADPLWVVDLPGVAVNAVAVSRCVTLEQSCAVAQRMVDAACPCEADVNGLPWKSHGDYVSCVARAFDREMLRSQACLAQPVEKVILGRCIVSPRAQSDCGK